MLWLKDIWARLRNLNGVLLLATCVLSGFGVCFIKSACSIRALPSQQELYWDHLGFAVVGIGLLLVVACLDYRKWIQLAPWAYAGILVLLILVLVIGTSRMGARRWLFGVQPSEPAKLVIVMMLAYLLGDERGRLTGLRGLIIAGLVVAIPAGLILVQPDLGTALVLGPTLLVMLFVANVAPKILWPAVMMGLIIVVTILSLVYVACAKDTSPERRKQLLALTCLRKHQYERIEVFLYPDRDIYGNGYTARQAEIAIGSGGLTGKGFLKGDQNLLGYLPAVVSFNDFIFPVFAEEMGFLGSLLLLGLYLGGIFLPGLIIASRCMDNIGKLLCTGITALMFCHMFINIGMTVRLVPITGLPLPFISHGGTFMVSMMLAIGMIQSVAVFGHTKEGIF